MSDSLMEVRDLSLPPRLLGVSLRVGPGECVGLIGPNGAGKTTLLRAALGLVKARGESSLLRPKIARRPAHVAYLAQEREAAWPIAVKDLVALGRAAHPDSAGDAARVAEATLARLGLTRFAGRLLSELSGGERARVLLARALAQGAPLLLADEPCAALDPAQAIRTLALLRAEADAGRGVLTSLHDLTLAARYCTRLVVLQGGHLVADGPPEAVLTPDLCARVFGVRMAQRDGAWALTGLAYRQANS